MRTERKLSDRLSSDRHRHKERSRNKTKESRKTEDAEAGCHASYPEWQPGNKSFNTSEEDEQRRFPEPGVLQHRPSIFRKPPLTVCLNLLHQFVSEASDDRVFKVFRLSQTSQPCVVTAEANQRFPLPRFSSQQFGLFERKKGAFSFSPGPPSFHRPTFSLSLLLLNVALGPRCLR